MNNDTIPRSRRELKFGLKAFVISAKTVLWVYFYEKYALLFNFEKRRVLLWFHITKPPITA